MKQKTSEERIAGISSEAVETRTGKTWEEWFTILDKADATTMSHREISNYPVQHTKLASSRDVQKMKKFWSTALDQLKSNLES